MKTYSTVGIFAVLLLLTSTWNAQAVVIDFTLADSGTEYLLFDDYQEDGYNFDNPGSLADASIIAHSDTSSFHFNNTGSDFYNWNDSPITVTNMAGTAFDFVSLDVGGLFNPSSLNYAPASFSITGLFTDGSNAVYQVTGVSDFQNVVLNWADLTRVQFHSTGGGSPAIDNLILEEYTGSAPPPPSPVPGSPAPVPEPATMLLFGVGLAGLATRLRSKGKSNG